MPLNLLTVDKRAICTFEIIYFPTTIIPEYFGMAFRDVVFRQRDIIAGHTSNSQFLFIDVQFFT
jgi:hypothetical protein